MTAAVPLDGVHPLRPRAVAPPSGRATFDASRRTRDARMEQRLQELVEQAERGDPLASEQLFTTLYDELHRLAQLQLRRRGPDLSLGATTLLHEAYLALARADARFVDLPRFMGYVARAMRGLIIDHARRGRAKKRGGGAFEITLAPDAGIAAGAFADAMELERLGDALDELATLQPALAELVDLHFFGGLAFTEIAALRGVSDRTVQRDWRKARLFLHRTLLGGGAEGEGGG